jgi:hypothetical protein
MIRYTEGGMTFSGPGLRYNGVDPYWLERDATQCIGRPCSVTLRRDGDRYEVVGAIPCRRHSHEYYRHRRAVKGAS